MVFHGFRHSSKRLQAALAIWLSIQLGGAGLMAQQLPDGGVVRAGDAQISSGNSAMRIVQTSDRAIIDWRSFGIGAGGQVVFVQPTTHSATLNRVTGDQVSVILGRLDANGQVLLINPNGVVFGGGSQINVGSLIASTSNVSNTNFMAGRLIFDQPGRPGAGILNAGALTAAESGLVALVAPHVRNDGVIVARLGRVMLGAADTFTIDLYGDALINLALSDANAGQLHGFNGDPVTSLIANTGTINTAGGRTVLMTARNAKNVLDNLINMSGTIKADSAVEQGGRILLLGEGGNVDVSGALSARGATGGAVDVLGDRIHLGSTAAIDAGGANGGGIVHVGGAFQGGGETYRASQTTVDMGATLKANAGGTGNGGEVVVWSDGRTAFSGAVEAKGGANGGDGGRMEVSGKGTLDFLGLADASAAAGHGGSLLLDPAFLNIDATEAGIITRVLRTGTTTNLAADVDINVNSAITGGDREAGGGLTMTAGNNINVNDFIVTNDGAINLLASRGTVNIASGKALFAGTAPITITAGGSVRTGALITSGSLAIQSIAGSVAVDSFIDGHTGPVSIRAAGDVDINQPILNLSSGGGLSVNAGNDINVNALVDGRGGATGGAVAMTASRDLNVNESIVTNNGGVALTATNGAVNVSSGRAVVAGTGAIAVNARGDITTGAFSGGALAIASTAGTVNLNGLIDSVTGDARISAGADVNVNQLILNGQSGAALAVNAGRDVNVNAQIDGRGGPAGGAVALSAGRNLNVNQSLATNNGAVNLTAGGTAAFAAGTGVFTGSGAIAMRSAGDLTMGVVSGGSLSAASSGGSVNVNGVIDATTGRVDLSAGQDVLINQAVLSPRSGNALTATAGRDIAVNAQIDGRGGASGGSVTLNASRNVAVNSSIVTNNGAIGITATGGSANMGASLVSGAAPITVTAGGDVTTSGISGGSLSATSNGGSVNVNGVIDSATGRVDLNARRDVNINQAVLSLTSGSPFTVSAGNDINVNARVDSTTASHGGSATLSAGRNVNVNAAITTRDAAISVSAAGGTATVGANAGLFAGTGAIGLSALGNVTTGVISGGPITIASTAGSVAISGNMSGIGGAIAINAAGEVDVDHSITNPGAFSPLTITAGTDIKVNAAIDGRSSPSTTPGSAVTLTAGQNVLLNKSIDTQDAAINVTATQGTVTTAAGQGLFAGSGPIAVQSGQTLSTGITSTTGTLSLRSTNGSVNVNTAIAGSTGAVTIQAATDVNVNQAISNKRGDAPLNVLAGHDINVNATIDGRDPLLTGSSGTTTLTAGNSIAINKDIVTRDSALTLTAQGGSIVQAAGIGLFAGNGTISETSAQTLTPGITSTTGALNFRSTQGGVNISTAIGDTTGAVTINAATAVNINQPITNLKSGNNLSVTAGTDINVLAQVDGRNGAAAGGTVTMTAGNNLNVVQPVATNNGAISLTATAGSVTLPIGTEVISPVLYVPTNQVLDQITTPMQAFVLAGNAPVTITSGGNFTLTSPVKTTGALTITSTNGNVTTAAPIDSATGVVTVTAGNGLIVNREIRTNSQAITLNAGAGGITVNTIVDHDYSYSASVNASNANLTLNSVGNVSILDSRGVGTLQTLTIDTRGQILTGKAGDSTSFEVGRPAAEILNADQGIVSWGAGFANSITATSSSGSITMSVASPDQLHITTGTPNTLDCPTCDINLSSSAIGSGIGANVVLNAGGSVNLSTVTVGTLDATARSTDVNFSAITADQLTASAGRDVNLSALTWVGSTPTPLPSTPSGGPLTLTAGRNIVTTVGSPIHISNGQTLTLTAGQDVTLNLLESLGAVNIAATNGNVTLNNDIGPHIVNLTAYTAFNPTDLGVASLSISAPEGSINMQGARAEGDVTINYGGTLTAAKEITSTAGPGHVFVNPDCRPGCVAAVAIGSQNQLDYPAIVAPAIAPGPHSPAPGAPGIASGGGAGLPAFGEIPVAAADQIVAGVIQPGAASGSITIAGTPGGAGAPGLARGFTSLQGSPIGPGAPDASGVSSDTGSSADTASALRDAEQDCGKGGSGGQGDTGLNAVAPGKTSGSGGSKGASCSADAPAQDAPAAPGAAVPPAGAVPPASTAIPPAATRPSSVRR